MKKYLIIGNAKKHSPNMTEPETKNDKSNMFNGECKINCVRL